MRTAAELDGEAAHIYDAYDVAVFLAEQRLRAGLLRLFDGHVFHNDIESF